MGSYLQTMDVVQDVTINLLEAVEAGDLPRVKHLIADVVQINEPDFFGLTLHVAAGLGHVEIVQELLAKGACVYKKDNDGDTPLHHAARRGHVGVIQALIAKGATVNQPNKRGRTPMHVASNGAVVQELIAKGVCVNQTDKYGDTP